METAWEALQFSNAPFIVSVAFCAWKQFIAVL